MNKYNYSHKFFKTAWLVENQDDYFMCVHNGNKIQVYKSDEDGNLESDEIKEVDNFKEAFEYIKDKNEKT